MILQCQLSKYSAGLVCLADTANLTLDGDQKREERLHCRFQSNSMPEQKRYKTNQMKNRPGLVLGICPHLLREESRPMLMLA